MSTGSDLTLDDPRSGIEQAFARDPAASQLPSAPTFGQQIETIPLGAQRVAVMRDESKILQKIKTFAAAAGDDFYYQWDVKNKDGTKGLVEGASIQCALYVLRTYGNCDVDIRVQDIGTHWIFYARFTDFETGFRLTRAYQQRKDQSTGIKDKDRQIDIVFQIGQSKAIRNVVTNAIRPFTDYAFEEAKHSLIEKVGRDLEKYRLKVAKRLQDLQVNVDRVERILGRVIGDWLARDVARVIAEIQSVTDGMMGVDDMWPPIAIALADGQARPKPEDFTEKKAETNGEQKKGDPEKKPEPADQKKDEPVADPKPAEETKAAEAKPAEAKKPEEAKPAEPPKPQFPPAPRGVNEDWWGDKMKELAACSGIHGAKGLDALQEEMEKAVEGDEAATKTIADVCNARARAIMTKDKPAKKK